MQSVFVINLPHRTDRRADMERQLARIGWNATFFPAIRPDSAGGFPSIGARGCFLSHLAILKMNLDTDRLVIIEDDANFHRDFSARWKECLETLNSRTWSVLYSGNGLSLTKATFLVPSTLGVTTTHFIAFNKHAIARFAAGLETILSRPAGHPLGGAMHVDGAYSTIRKQNPDLIAYAHSPALAYQRPSRSDIADLPWKDRVPFLNWPLHKARQFKEIVRGWN